MRSRLRLIGFGLLATLYVWRKAVLRVGEVKERKAARRAARGA